MTGRLERRRMAKATDLMPPNVAVLDRFGVSIGPNPELVAAVWLIGLLGIAVVSKVVFGFSMPVPFLLALTVLFRLALPLAEGLIVSDVGFTFTGWDGFRGEPTGNLRPAGPGRPVAGKVRLWIAPVHIGDERIWMTRGQIERLHRAERAVS